MWDRCKRFYLDRRGGYESKVEVVEEGKIIRIRVRVRPTRQKDRQEWTVAVVVVSSGSCGGKHVQLVSGGRMRFRSGPADNEGLWRMKGEKDIKEYTEDEYTARATKLRRRCWARD